MAWISELEESKEEGRAEGREENAIMMLKDHLETDKIVLYSGLSRTWVLELQQMLNKK